MRVAVVVQRYGVEVNGGAEVHARQVAERLARRHRLTVLTTRALDHITWADHYPGGAQTVRGVEVIRFGVPVPRDMRAFAPAHRAIMGDRATPAEERRFLAELGPWALGLLAHLRDRGAEYDAVIFFTALYATTLLGLPLVAERSLLVPTLHDEAPMRLRAYGRVLPQAACVLYNTPEERALAQRLYRMPPGRDVIAGVGVEPPAVADRDTARRLGVEGRYLLYVGRVDRFKGCAELLTGFDALARLDPDLHLVLAGRPQMELADDPRVHALGFVEDADVAGLMLGADAVVVPSRLESLSMVTLEAMALGVPVLVPADSPVLAAHVRRSRAGLMYEDLATFVEACLLLRERPSLRGAMGANGRRYVAANYSWSRVDAVYERALSRVAGAAADTLARRRTGVDGDA